jgi:hypothetical protein
MSDYYPGAAVSESVVYSEMSLNLLLRNVAKTPVLIGANYYWLLIIV